jgi:hypothetical protein
VQTCEPELPTGARGGKTMGIEPLADAQAHFFLVFFSASIRANVSAAPSSGSSV